MYLQLRFFLPFAFYLLFSKYGNIKLGDDHDKPAYSTGSWLAMLYSAAMGCGLVFWGVSEPVFHYLNPPIGKGSTIESADTALRFTFFHWGFNAWAIYAIVALGLAYFQFRRKLPGLISSIFYPVLGQRIHGPIGKGIDIYAVFMTALGVSTVLGVTSLQFSAGLNKLSQIPNNLTTQIGILLVVTALFLISAATGLDKGIKILSNFNMITCILLMLLVLFLGPTVKILNIFLTNTGAYLDNLVSMTLRMDPYGDGKWISAWTIFYWAWWSTWAPFVGSFIARISQGRTIKEFLLGVLVIPSFVTFLWFSVFGGTAIHFIHDLKNTGLAEVIQKDVAVALFAFLDNFPFSSLLSIVALILITSFFVTSADSATFVLGMYSGNGTLDPTNKIKLIWGLVISAGAIVLLMSGGVTAVQTVSIAIAFPFYILMVGMCYTLLKSIRSETQILMEAVTNKP
ncbi:BCCT family transporter, partial [Ammoniphilus sp. 3BR4]|uniref:BCCT family transporter n=1 Tax=Ammoniphilus sp. 3BR4 TaxID=3158265 RepID=UPI003464FEAE